MRIISMELSRSLLAKVQLGDGALDSLQVPVPAPEVLAGDKASLSFSLLNSRWGWHPELLL